MKAMMMKGVAEALTPLDGVFPGSRNALRAVVEPKKQIGSPAAQPPEADASDPNLLEPTIYLLSFDIVCCNSLYCFIYSNFVSFSLFISGSA
jgi:hypothetical protein